MPDFRPSPNRTPSPYHPLRKFPQPLLPALTQHPSALAVFEQLHQLLPPATQTTASAVLVSKPTPVTPHRQSKVCCGLLVAAFQALRRATPRTKRASVPCL